MQGDDPVLRAVEQMVEAPDFPWARVGDGRLRHEIFYADFPWPSDEQGKVLREIFGLVRARRRGVPYPLAIEGERARISAPDVLRLAWQFMDRKITKAEFWAELGTLSPSFRAIQHEEPPRRLPADSVKWKFKDGELNELKAEIASLAATGDERAVHLGREFKDVDDDRIDEMKAYPVVPEFEADDDELLRFHVEREAEEDRKRVCLALPKAELRSVLAELCKRDWTRKDQWLRLESLRRWLAMSPEAIRHAAGSGRWKTDIAPECPESRKHGRGGRPSHLLGPRAAARVLRGYAAAGGELGEEAREAAAVLDRIVRWRVRSGCCPKIPPSKSQ